MCFIWINTNYSQSALALSVNFIENTINEISQEEICEKGLSIEQKNVPLSDEIMLINQ